MDKEFVQLANAYLASLLKLIRYFKLYPPNHPYISDMIEETDQSRKALFEKYPKPFKAAIMGGVLFLGKDPLDNPNALVKNLIKLLTNIKIRSFEMEPAMTTEEMVEFCKLAAREKEELVVGEGEKEEFNAKVLREHPMPHIRINEIEVKIGEEDELGELKEVLMGVDEALGHLGEQAKTHAPKTELTKDRLMAMVDAILSRVQVQDGKVDPNRARRSFEEIGDMLSAQCENLEDLKMNLLQTVFRMPKEVQKSIFGEAYNDEEEIEMDKMLLNLSIRSRANILRNVLKNKDAQFEELQQTLQQVIKEESEVVELAELLTKEFGLTASSEEEKREYISRLSALIQSGLIRKEGGTIKAVVPRNRGTVLIAEGDMDTATKYQKYLHGAGFETIIYTDGQQALEGIKEHKPCMIVMELKLPGLHGLDIIYFLRKNREFRVPVLICTAYPEFQNEFEIQSYPKLEYLIKPVEKEKFLEALEKHAPPPPKPEEITIEGEKKREPTEEELQLQEDLEKARGVQAKLLPESLPDLVGFDIGTFYCSCKEVGGDYFDIIPIDRRHTGILIADVSGKGVSGAMVMVMVRSVMKLVAPNYLSPRQTLIEVNNLIAKDMKMGMFVTALYMILDEKERKLVTCCAGHNPALIWRHKTMSGSYMKPSGMALGITTSSVFQNSLKEETIELEKNDLVCVYTDGVVEAMSPEYEEFGEERLLEVVSKNVHKTCEEIIDAIYESILAHEDTAPRHDDISIIALKAI